MPVYDVEEIEYLLDDEELSVDDLTTSKVTFYDDKEYPVTVIDGEPFIMVDFECAKCGRNPLVFLVGRGAPGWCYIHDMDGHYLGDLRNQEYICSDCNRSKK